MTKQRWFIGVLLLLSLTWIPQSTCAEGDDFPQAKIAASWQGHVRYDGWTELLLTVDNPGKPWEGMFRITDKEAQATYWLPLNLAANAHKQYRVPLYLKSYHRTVLSLVRSDGIQRVLAWDWIGSSTEDRVCALIADDEMGPSSLFQDCDVTIVIPSIAQLPETAMAWDTVDVVIINGASTVELNTRQRQAMLAWVSTGGHLILSGGGTLPQTLAGVATELQAATAGSSYVVTKFDGQHDVILSQIYPGEQIQILKAHAENPVAVRRHVGYGKVDILAWDITRTDLNGWVQRLWRDEPTPAISFITDETTISQGAMPSGWSLLRFPKEKLPFRLYWLCLFPVYIGLMGPLTPIIAKRFRHPFAAWGMLFLWIGVSLLLLSLMLSGLFSHAFPLVHESAIIYTTGNDLPARVIQGTAIYAPRHPTLSWDTRGTPRTARGNFVFDSGWMDGKPYPITIFHDYQKAKMQTQWPAGVVTWGTEGLTTSPREDTNLHFGLYKGNLALTGDISSSISLRQVNFFILAQNRNYRIPITVPVEPFSPLKITQVLTTGPDVVTDPSQLLCSSGNIFWPHFAPAPPFAMKSVEEDTAIQPNRCFLTGTANWVPFPAQNIKGTHSKDSCIIFPVPCPTHESTQVPINLVGMIQNDAYVGVDEDANVYLNSTEAELSYGPPEYLLIQHITSLTLTLTHTSWQGVSASPLNPREELKRLSLWDWQTQEWIDIAPLPTDESPITFQGADAARFFDAQQGVKISLRARRPSGTSFRLLIQALGTP